MTGSILRKATRGGFGEEGVGESTDRQTDGQGMLACVVLQKKIKK